MVSVFLILVTTVVGVEAFNGDEFFPKNKSTKASTFTTIPKMTQPLPETNTSHVPDDLGL